MNANDGWRSIDDLPAKSEDGWSIIHRSRFRWEGLEAIKVKVGRWIPAVPLLVGAPGSTRHVPPILVPELEQIALRAVRQASLNVALPGLVVGVLSAIVAIVVAIKFPHAPHFFFGWLILWLAGMLWLDYRIALSDREGIAERALFLYWLIVRSRAGIGFRVWLLFCLGIGTAQLLLMHQIGGLAPVFHRVGVMYELVRDGEVWRLLTGPYLHYSLEHYSVNLALLVTWGALAYAWFGASSLWAFVLANPVAAWAQMSFGGTAYDSVGGISGGIYSLAGAILVAGAINRSWLPRGFWLLCLNLTALGILAAELMSESAATIAHLAGLGVGALAGLVYGRRA